MFKKKMTTYSTKNKFPSKAYLWLTSFSHSCLPKASISFSQLRTQQCSVEILVSPIPSREAKKQSCLSMLLPSDTLPFPYRSIFSLFCEVLQSVFMMKCLFMRTRENSWSHVSWMISSMLFSFCSCAVMCQRQFFFMYLLSGSYICTKDYTGC